MKNGDYIICRTRSAGVFAGVLRRKTEKEIELTEARRLWYWDGAASLSQLSQEGVKAPHNCKFPMPVPSVILSEWIELLPVSKAALTSIQQVPIWER